MDDSIYRFTQTTIFYGTKWLRTGNIRQLLVVSHSGFQQNLWKDLWDTWKIPFTVLYKVGFFLGIKWLNIGNAQRLLVEVL
jgi:hypothetical protein